MKLRPVILATATALLVSHTAPAQHGPHMATPYAGLQDRQIKALSDQQIADLKAGRGMGLALAAELNGYPGPMHVLELADALQITDRQRSETARLFAAMKAEAIGIGERIIVSEATLDRSFADRSVTRASLDEALSRIASDQAELRAAHLRYHLAMVDLLSADQLARYAELRGYRPHSSK